MQYAILCYNSEEMIAGWSQEQDEAVMTRLQVVHDKLHRENRLGPAVRLGPTRTATTLMKDKEPHYVVDGPYAETKEALLGFYVIDCPDTEAAMDVARQLAQANPGGAYEVRPLMVYQAGVAIPELGSPTSN